MSSNSNKATAGSTPKAEIIDLLEQMRGPFLDSSQQKLDRLNELLEGLWADREQSSSILPEFIGIIHSLKGGGGSFGFPQITMICHNFETYFEDIKEPSDDQLTDFQSFLDKLSEGLNIWPTPDDETIDQMVGALPQIEDAPPVNEKEDADISVLLVSQAKSIMQMAKFFFTDFGCDVVEEEDPFQAFITAVETKPRLIISSVVLEGLSGIDLVASLKAMKAMSGCRFAILSSASDIGEISDGVPDGVSLIATDDMESGIEKVLTELG